jgi:hypothetical protein
MSVKCDCEDPLYKATATYFVYLNIKDGHILNHDIDYFHEYLDIWCSRCEGDVEVKA